MSNPNCTIPWTERLINEERTLQVPYGTRAIVYGPDERLMELGHEEYIKSMGTLAVGSSADQYFSQDIQAAQDFKLPQKPTATPPIMSSKELPYDGGLLNG